MPSVSEQMYANLMKSKEEMMSLLKSISSDVNSLAAAMMIECERIRPELGRGYRKRLERIMYKTTPEAGEGVNVSKESSEKPVVEVKALGKRACSICRKSGHKAPKCPENSLRNDTSWDE